VIRRLRDWRPTFDDDDAVVYILDPEPRAGHGDPMAFKAPLEN
jgi:hypothetical protein